MQSSVLLDELCVQLGYVFKDHNVLREALIHPSTLPRYRPSVRSGKKQGKAKVSASDYGGITYERLEFLGDRVLGLVIAHYLYIRHPAEDEGELARRFTALVRREALAEVARSLSLGRYLILSRGEEESGGRDNTSILADACEAILGAMYLDGGLEAASAMIHRFWHIFLSGAEPAVEKDAKTLLQEWAQGKKLPLPVYEVVEQSGSAHKPHFVMSVKIDGIAPVQAAGASKKIATQAAASALLQQIKR